MTRPTRTSGRDNAEVRRPRRVEPAKATKPKRIPVTPKPEPDEAAAPVVKDDGDDG